MILPASQLLELLTAAYHVERTEEAWLDGVLDAFRDATSGAESWCAYFADASAPDSFETWGYCSRGAADSTDAGYRSWVRNTPDLIKRFVHLHAPCNYGSQIPRPSRQFADNFTATHDTVRTAEMFGLNALDAGASGCALLAMLPHVAPARLTAADRDLWGQVAAHLRGAMRIGRHLRGTGTTLVDGAAAVISPQGRIEHASGEATARTARDALRDAAVQIEAVRARHARLDASEVARAWQALIAGRWTLVDSFDRGGRRYFVARNNRPDAPAASPLSAREAEVLGAAALGHSNKMIAHELGLAPSSVATHLARAGAKLGVSNRVELIAAFSELCRR